MSSDSATPMDEGCYDESNEAKAEFEDAYTAPTPHRYLDEMSTLGYQIGEQARPYCLAAADMLLEQNGDAWPVQILDVGCSYGMASAFVRYGCSFPELVSFFDSRAPREYVPCIEATRIWLNAIPPRSDLRVVGLDSSEPAVSFGLGSGLLDGGIARNFEEEEVSPTAEDRAWFRGSNLLVSTGAVGYLTETTFAPILAELGRDHPGSFSPVAVLTILRMFEPDSMVAAFEAAGLKLVRVPNILLPQRAFVDEREQEEIVGILRARQVDVEGWEASGVLFADLYVGATSEHVAAVVARMQRTQDEMTGGEPLFAATSEVSRAAGTIEDR